MQRVKFWAEPNTIFIENTWSKSHYGNREISTFLSFISPSYSNLNLFQWEWISSKQMGVLFLIFNAIAHAHGNPKVIKLKQPHMDLSVPTPTTRSTSSAR